MGVNRTMIRPWRWFLPESSRPTVWTRAEREERLYQSEERARDGEYTDRHVHEDEEFLQDERHGIEFLLRHQSSDRRGIGGAITEKNDAEHNTSECSGKGVFHMASCFLESTIEVGTILVVRFVILNSQSFVEIVFSVFHHPIVLLLRFRFGCQWFLLAKQLWTEKKGACRSFDFREALTPARYS